MSGLRRTPRRLAFAGGLFFALTLQASAATQCETDPDAVLFEPTVDDSQLNNLLSRLGNLDVDIGTVPIRISGLCVDHQLSFATGFSQIPVGDAPFTVTTGTGSINVLLRVVGPFQFGIDGSSYQAVGCATGCRVEIPYVGEIFDACQIEEDLARPIFSLLDVNASFDDMDVSQTADTCVLGDCTAVHPLRSTTTTIHNFDVNIVGSCSIGIDFPDPFPDLGPIDLCAGLDGLITDLVRPEIVSAVNNAFVTPKGEGLLVQVFSRQIVKDGCQDIPEVKDCKASQTAGLLRGSRNPAVNAALYLLPLGLVGGLAFRIRQRHG